MATKTKSLYNLQAAFRSNPKADTLYVTSDGLPFKVQGDANRHAAQLLKKATPTPAPEAGTPAATALAAVGVVTTVSRASMGVIPPGKVRAGNSAKSVGNPAAIPAPATAPVTLTYEQATAANEAAQVALTKANGALDAANTKLANAKTALGALPPLPVAPAKADAAQVQARRRAQQLVNSCTAAVGDANAAQADAAYDAQMAKTNLDNTPAQ